MGTKVEKPPLPLKDQVFSKFRNYERTISYYDAHVLSRDEMLKTSWPDESLPEIIDNKTKIGIEVEVENAPHYNREELAYWAVHEDSSLRNNGREFVTYPIWGKMIPRALSFLFNTVLLKGYDFSKRTSVHVHMNARNMTPSQVTAFTCLFIVFEKLLYKFVGHNRDNNIFCVPMQKTLISNALLVAMEDGFRHTKWYKYSGFNLLPLMTQGSVEIRQLHGTDDIALICNWINLLLRLRNYAVSKHLDLILAEIKDLNTNSQYEFFMREVFQDQMMLLDRTDLDNDMESGVVCVKQSTVTNKFHQGMLDSFSFKAELVEPIVVEIKKMLLTNGYTNLDLDILFGEGLTEVVEDESFVEDDFDAPVRAVDIDNQIINRQIELLSGMTINTGRTGQMVQTAFHPTNDFLRQTTLPPATPINWEFEVTNTTIGELSS